MKKEKVKSPSLDQVDSSLVLLKDIYKEIFYPKIWFKELLLIGSLLDLRGSVCCHKLGEDQTEHDDGVHKDNDSAM